MQSREGAIEARIIGDVSGQVAIGGAIHQTQGFDEPALDRPLEEIAGVFHDLRTRIGELTAGVGRDGALQRVDELHQAVIAEDPNPVTMRYVVRWFAKRHPHVAGLLADALSDPAVAARVDRSEVGLAASLRTDALGG